MTKIKRRTSLWPTDMTNVSKLICLMGESYSDSIITAKDSLIGNNPILVRKAFYFLYLTGSRVGEILRAPYPTCTLVPKIEFNNGVKKDVILVSKQNEKHFVDKEKEEREILRCQIPIFSTATKEDKTEYEERMWNYVLGSDKDYWKDVRLDIFEQFGGYSSQSAFSKYISTHFKIDMVGEDGLIRAQEGLVAHQLRHLRCYFLKINLKFTDRLTASFFGWNASSMAAMCAHYVPLARQLRLQQQMELLKDEYMPEEPKNKVKDISIQDHS